jgi:ribonuclease HI
MNRRKQISIYTDGSCDTQTGDGGWAYLLTYGDHRKSASGFEADTTNNRMELTAAVRALHALTETCDVTLITDSQYLKKAFTDRWLQTWQENGWKTANRKPVKNRDLWLELLKLSSHHQIDWEWTRGHTGHEENELVDRLALKARKTRQGKP